LVTQSGELTRSWISAIMKTNQNLIQKEHCHMKTKSISITSRANSHERSRRKCIQKFLYYFPGGYSGKKYIAWEREYKWNAHVAWEESLNKRSFKRYLEEGNFLEIAKLATAIESKTNLLFSFEKMALRDAVKTKESAEIFSVGLFSFLHGKGTAKERFESFRDVLAILPVKQTRVLTWPLQTVFGFIAEPSRHIFLKPTVTKKAALKYQYDFYYHSRPNWQTYESLLGFAELVQKDTAQWNPKDMIDLQSFIWVVGSEEYPD
jgi:hypothetical protein